MGSNVNLCGIQLDNPVIPASGTFGFGVEYENIVDLKKLGAVSGKGLTLEEAAGVIAAPFWSTIEQMPEAQRERLAYLRETFASLLITGPFSILLGFTGGMMALNDRLKLRSMVCAEKGEAVYFASEECAIRVVEPNVDRVWAPRGGEPVIVTLEGGNR